jgi:hypothetical protein
MREVEAQAVGRDQRSLLGNVIAEHLPQRLVEEMGGRMIGTNGAAPRVVDRKRQRGADLQRAFLDDAGMHEQVARPLLRVGDLEAHAVAEHEPLVADLAA